MGKSMFFTQPLFVKSKSFCQQPCQKLFLTRLGDAIRMAPHLYNSDEDLVHLFEALPVKIEINIAQ